MHRRNGRVVWVERRVVYGSEEEVARRLRMIKAGRKVNTSYVERNNLGPANLYLKAGEEVP